MEENHHGTDSSIVSKPAEKFIQVDSIFIDLVSSDDKSDDRKSEQFSIRGYVSDMRKKDWKLCWPFSDLDDGHKLDKHIQSLPPVYDRSFNWRHGKSHWQENSNEGAAKGFISDSCHNLGNFPSAFRKVPKQGEINGRKMDDNASNLSSQPSCRGEKEKKLEVADSSTVALISQSEPGCASHEVTEIEPVNIYLKVTEESPAANFQAGKQTPADHQNGQLTLLVSENDSTVRVDQAHHTVKFQESGDTFMASDESTSSESAEAVGNSPHHCHLEKLHRRRTRKIRLLTELLGENGNMKAKHVESSPSIGSVDARYASKCQENIWHSDHKRERRLPRNEKCKHQEIPSSSSVDKQIQTWRGEIESPVLSLGTENALSGTIETKKGLWSSYKMDGYNTLGKKRSKKFPVVDPYSVSLLPSRGKDQYEIRATTEYRNDQEALDSAAIRVHHNEFSSRTPQSISLNDMEPKSCTSKNPNSSKEPEIVEGPSNVFPWYNGTIRNGSVTQKDVGTMKNRTVANPFQYASYESNEGELHLSLNNYLNPQRYHRGIVRQGENELPTLLPDQDDNSGVLEVTRKDIKTNYLRDPNPPYKASDVFYGQGVHSVLNGKMANLRMPLPGQNVDPHTDNGWSQLQQKDIYSGSNGKKTIEVQEPLALMKRQINQRVDQASDCGTFDDIPMEIVELMAKNQYERCLHDAENNKHLLETSNFSRTVHENNYADIYRNGRGLLEKPENLKQKAQARNGGNAAVCAAKVVEARKQKSADSFSNIGEAHFNTTHLQQTHMLGHNASIDSQEKPSSGIQFSAIGSKRQSCTENRKCNGTIVESGPYNSKIQSFGGCIDHLPVSEQNIEAAHIWSSMMPDHLSYGYQRFPAQSTDRQKISSPRSLHMGTANTQDYHNHQPTNLEKHARNYNSEACSRKFAENPFYCRPNVIDLHQNLVGSMELYSNETIPAMHLLSLMHAGMRSAPITAGGTHKLSKKPPIPRPLKGKEFSGMDICLNKTIQAISHPLSAFHDEVHIPEKSHYRSPAAPAIGASSCTFPYGKGFGTNTESQNRGKMKCSAPSAWSKGQKLPKSLFRSTDLGTNDGAFHVHGIHKGVASAPNFEVFALAHPMERSSEECKLVAQTKTRQNQKSTFETEICSVNKNPADFSLPEAGNIYMIGAEDFNFGRTVHSKNRPSSINFNGFKRQRSM